MAPSLKNSNNGVVALESTTHTSSITLEGSNFTVNGHVLLSQVPPNITATPSPYTAAATDTTPGCFVGFDTEEESSRHVVPIGKLKNTRFMSIFRFKVWWTTHWVGNNGRDLESETQMVILDKGGDEGKKGKSDDSSSSPHRPYVLLLPMLEGPFRASLQPRDDDDVDVVVESGSSKVKGSSFGGVVYMHARDDPYSLVKDAIRVARVHLDTFNLLEEKTPPGVVDKFGWCTWDAFYLKVHPQGVWEGVEGLAAGGCPPGFVLIDDGWQSISRDNDPVTSEGMNRTAAGEQMPCRLIKFEENFKFREYQSPRDQKNKGMSGFIKELKETFNTLDYVYVWHALCGYWGGLRPNVKGLPEAKLINPKLTPGLEKTMEDLAVDKIVNNGVGLVPPEIAHQLYQGLHSHLESIGDVELGFHLNESSSSSSSHNLRPLNGALECHDWGVPSRRHSDA